jgi:hypothetical protein
MCGPATTFEYSPRRLFAVASFADGPAASDGSGHEGVSADEVTAGGNDVGGGAPTPPSGPNSDAFLRNLKVPMPLGKKIRLVVRNTGIKFKTRQNCCGHPGEPGC